ncbi:MAG: hypothetical protein K2K82_08750 [Muribaculaceae bacterium]|nr:hypothetical protein [Muribaculaceae bacterium]
MKKIHPKLQAAIDNMSDEQIAKILNTKYSASDVMAQMKGLEQIKEQLCNPKAVSIEGWVARSSDCPRDLGLRVYSVKPKRYERRKGWNGYGYLSYLVDHRLFPRVTWRTEPQKVRITITPIEE